MGIKTTRRLAASLLKVGENRVRIMDAAKAAEALTRDDVRGLIKEGIIRKEPARGVSRALAKKRQRKRKLGRRRGLGSRKGSKYSKIPRKLIWMNRVRAQRSYLRSLRDAGKIESRDYRKVYLMIKGCAFRGVAQLEGYLKENKLVK